VCGHLSPIEPLLNQLFAGWSLKGNGHHLLIGQLKVRKLSPAAVWPTLHKDAWPREAS
jgi:hypothetical protein